MRAVGGPTADSNIQPKRATTHRCPAASDLSVLRSTLTGGQAGADRVADLSQDADRRSRTHLSSSQTGVTIGVRVLHGQRVGDPLSSERIGFSDARGGDRKEVVANDSLRSLVSGGSAARAIAYDFVNQRDEFGRYFGMVLWRFKTFSFRL